MKRSPMKRTGFKKRVHVDAAQTSLSSRARLVRGNRRCSLKATGRKAKLRETINRPNRARFAAMGLLDTCEARLSVCWVNRDLTWAHGKKDRFLTMDERKYLVIRACTPCHHVLDEQMTHEEMLEFVVLTIANRAKAA